MIVLDASAVIEVLLRTAASADVLRHVTASPGAVHAPELLDVEVAQVLRRYALAGTITDLRGSAALGLLAAFPLQRHSHRVFLPRIWELRANVTAYDATYLALGEALGATVITRDRKLATAPGHRARIELV